MLAEAMEGSFDALDLSMFSATAADKLQGGLTDAIDLMRISEITDAASLERELSELESGLGQARYVIDYVTEVSGLLGEIDASIVSGNLSDAGRELADINSKYDEMAVTLERLGVAVDATNLELARQEEIERLSGSVTGSWQDIIDQNTMGQYDLARQNLEKWRDEETKKAMELGLATGLLTRAYDVQLDKINEAAAAIAAADAIAGLNEELGVLSESLGGLESDLADVRQTIESIDAKRTDLTYSGFNLAYPEARAQSAASDYEAMFAAAGASPDAASAYLNFVDTYLSESQNAYKSSQQYLDIFAGVMEDLDSLGLTYETQDTILVNSIDGLTRQISALEERIAGLEANITVVVVDENGNEVSRTTETRRIIRDDDARITRNAA
jgi:chromosome segregation ATPase